MQKTELLIFDLLVDHSDKNGHKVALVSGKVRITYSQLLCHVSDFGRALLGAGIKRGDRIATLAPPSIEYWICFLASVAIGAQWFGLNPKYKKRELTYFIHDAEPRLVFTFPEFDGRNYAHELKLICQEADIQKNCNVIEFSGDSFDIQTAVNTLLAESEPVSKKTFMKMARKVRGDDIAAIVYTSGTTGHPKGAMLSHQTMRRCASASVAWMGESLEKVAMAFPINHIGSLNAVGMNVLTLGGVIYFLNRFNIWEIVKLGKSEGITLGGHNQTTLTMMLEDPDFSLKQLSSLKLLIHGGSKMDAGTLEKFTPLKTKITSVYAQTETCGYVLRSDFSASLEVTANTIGKPVKGVIARICLPDTIVALDDTEIGELQIKHDWHFSGYLNNDYATNASFTKDGYLKTGDLCIRRSDGNYEFIERINNTYKSGGYTVYPSEIETAILEHPKVGMAAVVPVADKKFGQVGYGFVSTRAGTKLSNSELRKFLSAEIANYKVPKKIKFMTSLPILANTKIDRQLLMEMANGDT